MDAPAVVVEGLRMLDFEQAKQSQKQAAQVIK